MYAADEDRGKEESEGESVRKSGRGEEIGW